VAADERASGGWRALGALLALALAFACAVMVVAMIDIGDTPRCDDEAAIAAEFESGDPEVECFEGSAAQKTISLILGWPSAVLAGLAAVLALYFVASGRHGRLVVVLTGAAVVLGGLSIVIGSV
jgi:hypothetical protein